MIGYATHLRIGSCLAYVYRVMDARGKFGEHERSEELLEAQPRATLASCTAKSMNQFFYNMATTLNLGAKTCLISDRKQLVLTMNGEGKRQRSLLS